VGEEWKRVPKPSHLRSINSNPAPAAPAVSGGASGRSVEVVAPGKRRSFPASEKLRIVREAAACTERGGIEALLRREGIYASLLAAWRKQLVLHGSEALTGRKRGPKPKFDAKDRRILELEKHSSRLEARISLMGKLLELQKKASEILGIDLESEGVS
jgi:transposase